NLALIGVFVHRNNFPHKALRDILETVSTNQVFIYSVNPECYLLTFNMKKEVVSTEFKTLQESYPNSVRFHRKQKQNVLYTINAIKEFEKKEDFKMNELENCCLIIENNKPAKLDLALVKIFKI